MRPTTQSVVQSILDDDRSGWRGRCAEYAAKFDKYTATSSSPEAEIEAAAASLPKSSSAISSSPTTMSSASPRPNARPADIEVEIVPGLIAGQKTIPVDAAGCYVPGGRYSHVASAIMTVTTAKVAGCKNIVACSPPRPGCRRHPAISTRRYLRCRQDPRHGRGPGCGRDGLRSVRRAKGQHSRRPGQPVRRRSQAHPVRPRRHRHVRGPTDSLILADKTADPEIVAADLVGQAEHGYNSPVWLVTDDPALAEDRDGAGAQNSLTTCRR
jgi:sulfopropanediol 3-dehydrogenase